MSLVAEERIRQLFIAREHSEREGIDSMSSGSVSPDLGELWRLMYPMSSQWEVGLEMDSDVGNENENENDDCYKPGDSADDGLKDYLSQVSDSPSWFSIRDFPTPSDVRSYDGWTEVEPREIVWEICRFMVLPHDKRW